MHIPSSLRLARWARTDCSHRERLYRLRAVVVHKGMTTVSGHYVCYVRTTVTEAGPALTSTLPPPLPSPALPPTPTPHTADTPSPREPGWLLLDDSMVTHVAPEAMSAVLVPLGPVSSTPYLLFYDLEL